MDGYVNPLNPSRLPVSSGQNSLQDALQNGASEQVKAGSAETSANLVSENNTDGHANAIIGSQDIQIQLEELQRSVTIVFWFKVSHVCAVGGDLTKTPPHIEQTLLSKVLVAEHLRIRFFPFSI